MPRRKKGNPISGWLVLDKPLEMTSTSAVNKIKRTLNAQKAGHAGTLDPLATGVLPIALGEATKTVPYIVDATKTYQFTVHWGIETNTDDLEGESVKTSEKRPSEAEIAQAIPQFTGEIEQIPPKYSAIKIDGKRAYKLARDGEEFELKPRTINIKSFEIIKADKDWCQFEVTCGKGTYIRSLARDLGRHLGCFGHISQLRRTRVGIFNQTNAISFDKILEKNQNLSNSAPDLEQIMKLLLPTETALDDIPALAISGQDAHRLKQGRSILLKGRDAPIIKGQAYAMSQDTLVAIGEVKQGELCPIRVFNLPT